MAERAEAHGRAARLLADVHASPGRVAEHLLATSPAGDGWVVEQLRAAGQEAMARGAPESATAYLRRALAEPPSVGDTATSLVGTRPIRVQRQRVGMARAPLRTTDRVSPAQRHDPHSCHAAVGKCIGFPSATGGGSRGIRRSCRRAPGRSNHRRPFDVGGHDGRHRVD